MTEEVRTGDGTLVEPVGGNETQTERPDLKLIIYINGESINLSEIDGDTHLRNKLLGHGISVTKQGDLILLSGSGGAGKACGGRMLINTAGGSITKHGGTVYQEITASPNDEATTSEQQGVTEIAYSGVLDGGAIVNSTGKVHIHAKDITIDAVDNLQLTSQNTIEIQAGVEGSGDLKINAANIIQKSDLFESHTSKDVTKTKEINIESLDPRASVNFVSAGHWNQKFKGDLITTVIGCAKLHIGGATSGIENPELTDRTTAFSVTTLMGNMTVKATKSMLFAVGGVAFPSALDTGSISMNASTIFKAESGAQMDLLAKGIATLDSKGAVNITGVGNIEIESKGTVGLKGTFIYLN